MHTQYGLLLALSSLSHCLPAPFTNYARQANVIPQYVLDNAPLCWLDTAEAYFPSSIADHVSHTYPASDSGKITTAPSPLTLSNLDSLNAYGNGGVNTYLTSNEGIAANPQPSWFHGVKPDSSRSAPGSVIITVDKGNGVLDAFYFYFYSYNQGNWVLNSPSLEFGDHVGDWEHNMIRFNNGVPTTMYFSQHSGGEAFTFSALQKDPSSGRPINYVAKGTHANYAISGTHDHAIPNFNLPAGALEDHTSQGTLWDPLSQPLTFIYTPSSNTFTSPSSTPVAWLSWTGRWGDPQLSDSNKNQKNLFGARKYVTGPTGPRDKNLARSNVCQGDPCTVLPVLLPR